MTFAAKDDLGIVVNELNEDSGFYVGDAIKMRSRGWGRFSMDIVLANSRLKILARASESDLTFRDATSALLGVSQITAGGYYEITDPTMAYEIKIQRQIVVTGNNATKVSLLLGRP